MARELGDSAILCHPCWFGPLYPRQARGQIEDDRQCAFGALLHIQGISKQVSHCSHPLSDYPPGIGGILTGDFKNRELEGGPFDVVDPRISDGHFGRTAVLSSIFPQVDAPGQDVSVDNVMRTLSISCPSSK